MKKDNILSIKNPETVDLVTQLIREGAHRLIAEANDSGNFIIDDSSGYLRYVAHGMFNRVIFSRTNYTPNNDLHFRNK